MKRNEEDLIKVRNLSLKIVQKRKPVDPITPIDEDRLQLCVMQYVFQLIDKNFQIKLCLNFGIKTKARI